MRENSKHVALESTRKIAQEIDSDHCHVMSCDHSRSCITRYHSRLPEKS